MANHTILSGFSKLSRHQRIELLQQTLNLKNDFYEVMFSHLHPHHQSLFDDFSENTLTNYYLPFGVAPNFLIDGQMTVVTMVTEESSVVAAASKAARFWAIHGGFTTRIEQMKKTGQIHFQWHGNIDALNNALPRIEAALRQAAVPHTKEMQKRGGGIDGFQILPVGDEVEGLWQLLITFCTADAMGANFINSTLEAMRPALEELLNNDAILKSDHRAQVIMCILSNYTPECVIRCTVSCPIDELESLSGGFSPQEFAERFRQAVYISRHDVFRATTHNKGIMNGMDAVVIATGNDFRAVEANAHAFASRQGKYMGLTTLDLSHGQFKYELVVPLSVGTVGGLTSLHPVARKALEIMGNPDARRLMAIVAAAGLANNFMAVASLVTHGIQQGHMKLHLSNMIRNLDASDAESAMIQKHFSGKTVSYFAVKEFLAAMRQSTSTQ